jgi:hypothetical protein
MEDESNTPIQQTENAVNKVSETAENLKDKVTSVASEAADEAGDAAETLLTKHEIPGIISATKLVRHGIR